MSGLSECAVDRSNLELIRPGGLDGGDCDDPLLAFQVLETDQVRP
jgi:hypothetical protein